MEHLKDKNSLFSNNWKDSEKKSYYKSKQWELLLFRKKKPGIKKCNFIVAGNKKSFNVEWAVISGTPLYLIYKYTNFGKLFPANGFKKIKSGKIIVLPDPSDANLLAITLNKFREGSDVILDLRGTQFFEQSKNGYAQVFFKILGEKNLKKIIKIFQPDRGDIGTANKGYLEALETELDSLTKNKANEQRIKMSESNISNSKKNIGQYWSLKKTNYKDPWKKSSPMKGVPNLYAIVDGSCIGVCYRMLMALYQTGRLRLIGEPLLPYTSYSDYEKVQVKQSNLNILIPKIRIDTALSDQKLTIDYPIDLVGTNLKAEDLFKILKEKYSLDFRIN